MPDFSPTDLRVINFLRKGKRSASTVGKECFPGKSPRPAVAHLALMKSKGLVRPVGGYWELTEAVTDPGPELSFDNSAQ